MPRLKTKKGVARRFKLTATGKLRYFRAGRRHLLAGKPSRHMRALRRPTILTRIEAKKIRQLIPYSS